MIHVKEYKEYKNNKSKLKIYDYVICHSSANYMYHNQEMIEFLNNNVGQYVKYFRNVELRYGVKYDNLPSNLNINLTDNLLWFERLEIIDYSNNKDELELKIAAQKYNL